jgi:hypothetical protein
VDEFTMPAAGENLVNSTCFMTDFNGPLTMVNFLRTMDEFKSSALPVKFLIYSIVNFTM